MPFPISHSSSFELPIPKSHGNLAEVVLKELDNWLLRQGARNSKRTEKAVSFKRGTFSHGASWGPLGLASSGEIVVALKPGLIEVSYQFSFRTLLILSILVMIAVGVIALFGDVGYLGIMIFLILGWLWIFGVNYIIAAVRLQFALERLVQKTIAAASPS